MTLTREDHAEYMRNWYAKRRADYFAGKSCTGCGATESLELDHIDPSQKISHRIWSWSAERRAAEIAKCQILCTDCHREKTSADRAARVQHGTEWSWRKGCRCTPCVEAKREASRRYRERRAA